jgi:hypothetical protein
MTPTNGVSTRPGTQIGEVREGHRVVLLLVVRSLKRGTRSSVPALGEVGCVADWPPHRISTYFRCPGFRDRSARVATPSTANVSGIVGTTKALTP